METQTVPKKILSSTEGKVCQHTETSGSEEPVGWGLDWVERCTECGKELKRRPIE